MPALPHVKSQSTTTDPAHEDQGATRGDPGSVLPQARREIPWQWDHDRPRHARAQDPLNQFPTGSPEPDGDNGFKIERDDGRFAHLDYRDDPWPPSPARSCGQLGPKMTDHPSAIPWSTRSTLDMPGPWDEEKATARLLRSLRGPLRSIGQR
jgi:hypothetical protein